MLTPWLELPGAESFFRWAGAIADADLLTLGTTGDAEAIKDTAVTQPLVVAMSLFVARELGGLPGPVAHTPQAGRDVVIAGHSVGELTAAALAGVLSVEAAIALTAVRGRAMARACALTPTGMSAVLGGDPDELAAALEQHGLAAANLNGGGQTVVAGPLEGLAALKAAPPAGARVLPLSVAGAFHTSYMAPAGEELEALVGGLRPADPSRLLLSNADGAAVGSGAEALSRLVSQVTSPVHFDACLTTLRELGVTAALELPPAAVAISTRVSSSSAQRRSAMPTRLWIHSSLVSMTWASSSLVTRRRGRYPPRPRIRAPGAPVFSWIAVTARPPGRDGRSGPRRRPGRRPGPATRRGRRRTRPRRRPPHDDCGCGPAACRPAGGCPRRRRRG